MKKRFLYATFILGILGLASALPLQAQSISLHDGGSGCFPGVQTLSFGSSDGGSPARNIYTGNVSIPSSSPDPYAAQVIFETGSWKVQVFDGGWNTIASSSITTAPNPPNLDIGSWADVGDCEPLSQFDGTGTQTSLPVSLVSATAIVEAQSATLQWTTVQEINNDRFVIEQQTVQGWKPVGELKGQGSAIGQNNYVFTVSNLPYGQHVFRIAQYDRNGSVSHSRPISVYVELTKAFALSEAYPNPFNPQTNFTLAVAQTQMVQIRLFDLQGREVAILHNGSLAGQTTHTFSFNGHSLASGKYFARVQGEHFIAHKQLVLMK